MPSPEEYDFFLRGDPDDMRLQLVEVTHPSFENVYRYVKNLPSGVTVKHEDGIERTYEYLPLAIKKSKSDDSLDQGLSIAVGDLGMHLPYDLDRLRNSMTHSTERPVVNYREYKSSDLDKPMMSALGLDVTDWQPTEKGSVFTCRVKEMNLTKTGIAYTLDNFPLLRGYV